MIGNTSVAAYHGPSFMIDDLTYHYDDGDVESVLINCHYPISDNSFVLQYGIIVQKAAHLPDPEEMARKMGDFIKIGFEQDVAIWKNKARIDNPLLCEEDGPVYQLRRWYEQFYVDVDDVTDEMTERFEFEIDTTQPNEAWRRRGRGQHRGARVVMTIADRCRSAPRRPARRRADVVGRPARPARRRVEVAQEQLGADQHPVARRRPRRVPGAARYVHPRPGPNGAAFAGCTALGDCDPRGRRPRRPCPCSPGEADSPSIPERTPMH